MSFFPKFLIIGSLFCQNGHYFEKVDVDGHFFEYVQVKILCKELCDKLFSISMLVLSNFHIFNHYQEIVSHLRRVQ